ncbi:MAG: ribonuclease D [Gammaproteobacteria bacterium]
MKKTDDIFFIDDNNSLVEFCKLISNETVLALDTEFIREKSYYPKLCLVQIAAGEHLACIDPLAITNLEPLLDLLYDTGKTKVLHAARQDLEIFYQLRKRLPQPIFDTQIAATLLGFNDQIGYANLIQKMLGVQLDKDQARTDWAQRPLNDKQIHYAANDVRYLSQIYPVMVEKLTAQNRVDWLSADFNELVDTALYDIDPDKTWRRVSGHTRLKPRQLVILQALAAWREKTAIKHDRPRRWILADDVLINLAQQIPQDMKQLEKIRGMKPGTVEKFGETIIKTILDAKQIPEEQWPKLPAWKRSTPQQEALIDLCMAYLKQLALQNNISPGILSNRKDMEKLITGDHNISILQGWRKQLVGQPLLSLLQGEYSLTIKNNKIDALPVDND